MRVSIETECSRRLTRSVTSARTGGSFIGGRRYPPRTPFKPWRSIPNVGSALLHRRHQQQAAVDHERLAGHVAGFRGGEEGDRRRDLMGVAGPLERNARPLDRGGILLVSTGHRGGDLSGRHRVDRYPVL